MATIGENIRFYRKRHGLTQGELAKDAGTTQYTVSEIELGHRDPHPATLRKLAEALDIDVADLFREPVDEPIALPVSALPPDLQRARSKLVALRSKWEEQRGSGVFSVRDRGELKKELQLLGEFLMVTANRELAWLRNQFPGEQDVTPRLLVGNEITAYLNVALDALEDEVPTVASEIYGQLTSRRAS